MPGSETRAAVGSSSLIGQSPWFRAASISLMSGRCSLPQNNSPSITKVGTPKTPFSSASREIRATSRGPSPASQAAALGRVGSGFGEHRCDDGRVFDVEFAFPEALEGDVDIAAQRVGALALGVQHAGGGERRIPDLLRAADHEAALSRLPPAIHVRIPDPPPLVRVAVLLDDAALRVEPCRAEIARDVEDVGQPVEADVEAAFEIAGRVLREIGVGAFEVDIDRDDRLLGHSRLPGAVIARSNATKQSRAAEHRSARDCFAKFILGRRKASTRGLAMTTTEHVAHVRDRRPRCRRSRGAAAARSRSAGLGAGARRLATGGRSTTMS